MARSIGIFAGLLGPACALLLAAPAHVEPAKAEATLEIVLRTEALYGVSVDSEGNADLLSVSLDGPARVERRALLLSVVEDHPVVWDIAGDRVVALSVGRQIAGQTTFSLVSTPLGDLPAADAEGVIRGHPRLHDLLLPGPEPLSRAMLDLALRETGSVLYDLAVTDDGRIRLALLTRGRLEMWQLDGARKFTGQAAPVGAGESEDAWHATSAFEVADPRPFRLLFQADDTCLMWSDGSIARVARGTLAPVARADRRRPLLVVDDKRERRPLLLFGGDGPDGPIDFRRSLGIEEGRAVPVVVDADVQRALVVLQAALRG